jgi:hypothetical protein
VAKNDWPDMLVKTASVTLYVSRMLVWVLGRWCHQLSSAASPRNTRTHTHGPAIIGNDPVWEAH